METTNNQVGRIRREGFAVHIGNQQIDLDISPPEVLRQLIIGLDPPITRDELQHLKESIGTGHGRERSIPDHAITQLTDMFEEHCSKLGPCRPGGFKDTRNCAEYGYRSSAHFRAYVQNVVNIILDCRADMRASLCVTTGPDKYCFVETDPHWLNHYRKGEFCVGMMLDLVAHNYVGRECARREKLEQELLANKHIKIDPVAITIPGPMPVATFISHDLVLCGRIRREPFVLTIGKEKIDLDELRNHASVEKVEPLLQKLKPGATRDELLFLRPYVHFGTYDSLEEQRLFNHWVKNMLESGGTKGCVATDIYVKSPVRDDAYWAQFTNDVKKKVMPMLDVAKSAKAFADSLKDAGINVARDDASSQVIESVTNITMTGVCAVCKKEKVLLEKRDICHDCTHPTRRCRTSWDSSRMQTNRSCSTRSKPARGLYSRRHRQPAEEIDMDRRDWLTKLLAFFASLFLPWSKAKAAPKKDILTRLPVGLVHRDYIVSFAIDGVTHKLIGQDFMAFSVGDPGPYDNYSTFGYRFSRLVGPWRDMSLFYEHFGNVLKQNHNPVDLFVSSVDDPDWGNWCVRYAVKHGKRRCRIRMPVISSVGISIKAQEIVVNEGLQLVSWEPVIG